MIYTSYGSVCELETQILSAGDWDFIEKGKRDTLKKDIPGIERILKALIKSLKNKPSNPWPLESLNPDSSTGDVPYVVTVGFTDRSLSTHHGRRLCAER
jgi:hypothetical protein